MLAWPEPTQTAKPWIRWWWPGSAVDTGNLTRELEAFAAAGFGGVEITPIYGAKGEDDRYLEFLSPQYVAMLEHTAIEARRLGLGVDMATGTGWPFGGPLVTTATAMLAARFEDGEIVGRPTGMKVKRAAPGGEGLVIDPYSTASLRNYLGPFATAIGAMEAGSIRAQFHDSFEYYGATFTSDLPARFEAMHGYDVQHYAAALLNQRTSETAQVDPESLARVRADYRATLAAMHLDFIRDWTEWSHARGFVTRNQSHGAPGNLLDLYGAVDIPETEMFGSTPFMFRGFRREAAEIARDTPDPLVMRMASSAAHVMNKPLVSCESLTWLREHWHETFAAAKPELDQAFLAGVNHVFYHGTCYSPADAPWPGWFFYAATQINDRNPLWREIGAFNNYVTRVQSVLQFGRPDNDILLYWPVDDLWHDENPRAPLTRTLTVHNPEWLTKSACGLLAADLEKDGYSFDFISDAQIINSTRVRNQRLVTPGGQYRVLVVPTLQFMPLETINAIIRLSESGAAVIFAELPSHTPGMGDSRRRDVFTFYKNVLSTQGRNRMGRDRVTPGSGKIYVGNPMALLTLESLAPRELLPGGFIRRAHESGHHYFVANSWVNGWVKLSVPFQSIAFMDPESGRIGIPATRTEADGSRSIYVQLNGWESLIIWTSSNENLVAPEWKYAREPSSLSQLDEKWRIEFIEGGPDLPDSVTTKSLVSWTTFGDERARRFAGTARYTINFEFPRRGQQSEFWGIDLGDVRETARVKLNGTSLGTLWHPPYTLDISEAVVTGTNTLEIEVTSLAANRIRDLDRRGADWKIMRDANIVNIHYRPLNAAQWPDAPAGLLGPVTLQPLQLYAPK